MRSSSGLDDHWLGESPSRLRRRISPQPATLMAPTLLSVTITKDTRSVTRNGVQSRLQRVTYQVKVMVALLRCSLEPSQPTETAVAVTV